MRSQVKQKFMFSNTKDGDMPDEIKVAEQHWEYIKTLLRIHGLEGDVLEIIGFHYKTAFIHGWKHGCEAMDGKG